MRLNDKGDNRVPRPKKGVEVRTRLSGWLWQNNLIQLQLMIEVAFVHLMCSSPSKPKCYKIK